MNRREFCFSLGAAVAGGIVVSSAQRETLSAPAVDVPTIPALFRAKKVFPEQWRNVRRFDSASEKTRVLQESLREFVGNDTALVVASLSGMSPRLLNLLQTESLHAGWELYLPADFPDEAIRYGVTREKICPLQVTRHGIESAKQGNTSCDGYLFSLSETTDGFSTKPRGMILCDASRGTWQTFLCQTLMSRDDVSHGHRNLANLQTAQWLDFAKKRIHWS